MKSESKTTGKLGNLLINALCFRALDGRAIRNKAVSARRVTNDRGFFGINPSPMVRGFLISTPDTWHVYRPETIINKIKTDNHKQTQPKTRLDLLKRIVPFENVNTFH